MTNILIWPDIYREQGHWLPAVSLAQALRSANYNVQFMGIPDCAPIVAPYGFSLTSILADIYPVGHTLNDRLEPEGQRWKPHHLLPVARRPGELQQLFTGSGAPNLLIAGYFAGLEALLLHYLYQVPLVTLTTYLRHPDEDPAIFAKGKLVHMPEPVVEKLIGLVTGNPDMDLDDFVRPLVDAPELIPCPREFDFFDEDYSDSDSVYYVEPMVTRSVTTPPADPPELFNPIPAPDGTRTLILGTSGSQVADYEDKARQFFRNLISMMKADEMDKYHLVLALGDKLLEEFHIAYGIDENEGDNDLPSNVTLAAWVDQLNLLPRCKAVFMHGGLATIKEAIYHGTPLVIVPHGKDQGENGLRVKRAGVGLAPSASVLSPTMLRTLFSQVTADTWINERLVGMQGLFQAQESARPSVEVIRTIVAP